MGWIIAILAIAVLTLIALCFLQRRKTKDSAFDLQCAYAGLGEHKQIQERLNKRLFVMSAERDQLLMHQEASGKEIDRQAAALDVKRQEITALTAERDGLLEANTKLANDYDTLSKQMPGLRPKAVRWSGPGGARERAEVAARSKATSQQEMPHAD